MAENKKSFLMYCDQRAVFDMLDDAQAGILIKHLFRFVNDEHPESPDILTAVAFEPIKQQLKRDLKRYKSKCSKNSDNARKRWNSENTNACERMQPHNSQCEPMRTDANHADNDNDTDTDTDKKQTQTTAHACNIITIDDVNYDVPRFIESVISKYPNKIGTVAARKRLRDDLTDDTRGIQSAAESLLGALNKYLESDEVKRGYVQKIEKWVLNWRDWYSHAPVDAIELERKAKIEAGKKRFEELQKNGIKEAF